MELTYMKWVYTLFKLVGELSQRLNKLIYKLGRRKTL